MSAVAETLIIKHARWVLAGFLPFTLSIFLFLSGTAVAQTPTPSPSKMPGVQFYEDIAYVRNGHERQKLDLYVPKELQGPLPLIVWIHGGGWRDGDKDYCPPLPWTKKGYVVASIGYRLCQDSLFPAQIEDCKAAIRWLREHAGSYKIDSNRVVAWGGSAGGHLASLLGTSADAAEWEQGHPPYLSRVQAVIDWYGRADLTPVCTDPSMKDSASASLLGGSGRSVADLAREASPLFHVSKDDPPFLIMHGDMDDIVPLSQSQMFANALREAGVPVMLVILKRVGHGGDEFLKPAQVRAIDAFLSSYLGATSDHSIAASSRNESPSGQDR